MLLRLPIALLAASASASQLSAAPALHLRGGAIKTAVPSAVATPSGSSAPVSLLAAKYAAPSPTAGCVMAESGGLRGDCLRGQSPRLTYRAP